MKITNIRRKVATLLLLFISCTLTIAQSNPDSEELGKALEYFTAAKYHEALLIFQRLDKTYKLNTRFKAYIGLCYYNEWDYETAAKYLDKAIPQLEAFAPRERSVYYYAAGECHFNLKQYKEAIPYYNKTLTVCYDREKPNVYYRLGLCYMFMQDWKHAFLQYEKSQEAYKVYKNDENTQSRLAQIERMAEACWTKFAASLPKDTINLEKIRANLKTKQLPIKISIYTDSTSTDDNIIIPSKPNLPISPINLDKLFMNKLEVKDEN